MQLAVFRMVTWLTVAAAIVSAVLLSGGDAALPDAGALPEVVAEEIENLADAVSEPDPPPAAPGH